VNNERGNRPGWVGEEEIGKQGKKKHGDKYEKVKTTMGVRLSLITSIQTVAASGSSWGRLLLAGGGVEWKPRLHTAPARR
jgi:hypothetical protein